MPYEQVPHPEGCVPPNICVVTINGEVELWCLECSVRRPYPPQRLTVTSNAAYPITFLFPVAVSCDSFMPSISCAQHIAPCMFMKRMNTYLDTKNSLIRIRIYLGNINSIIVMCRLVDQDGQRLLSWTFSPNSSIYFCVQLFECVLSMHSECVFLYFSYSFLPHEKNRIFSIEQIKFSYWCCVV